MTGLSSHGWSCWHIVFDDDVCFCCLFFLLFGLFINFIYIVSWNFEPPTLVNLPGHIEMTLYGSGGCGPNMKHIYLNRT